MSGILEWISVGTVSAERDENLSEYFFDNGILKKIINNPKSFLVLGRKGAGKTALFRHFKDERNKYLSADTKLVDLSFENYSWKIHSLLSSTDVAPSLMYKKSWEFLIYVETIKAFTKWCQDENKKAPPLVKKSTSILNALFGNPLPGIAQLIGKKILSLSRFSLPQFALNPSQSLEEINLSMGEVSFEEVEQDSDLRQRLSSNIEAIMKVFENAMCEITKENFKCFIAFDRVDEAWDSYSVDSSKKVIAGLVSAADSITQLHHSFLRPIVFLREDIFDTLDLNDKNKLREDCGKLLKWDRDSLSKLILRRVNFYGKKYLTKSYTDIGGIFESGDMRQRRKAFDYLISRSMMRPRDLICFIKRIIEAMKEAQDDIYNDDIQENPEVLLKDFIYEAEAGYSYWLKEEILDEWKTQKPEVKIYFDALQNHGYNRLDGDELSYAIEPLDSLPDKAQLSKILTFLFENSIIGFKTGNSNRWKFKCVYPSQGFSHSNEYRIHDGLVKALSLKESRTEAE